MNTARLLTLVLLVFIALSATLSAAQATVIDTPEMTLDTPNLNNGARYNADESLLMTWGQDAPPDRNDMKFHAQVWDAAAGDLLLTLEQPGMSSLGGLDAYWNHDESRILTRAGFNVKWWDANTGDLLQTFTHETATYGVRLNGDETRVLTWAYRGQMRIWDVVTGAALVTMEHAPLESGDVEFEGAVWGPDETQIYTSTWYGLYVWDATTGELLAQYPFENLIVDAEWHDGAQRWALVTNAGEVYTWTPAAGEPAQIKPAEEAAADPNYLLFGRLAWNPAGTGFYTNFLRDPVLEKDVQVWDAQSGDLRYTLSHDAAVDSASWSPAGDMLLVIDETPHLWDLSASEPTVQDFPAGSDNPLLALWNNDGTRFATISFGRTQIHIYDVAAGEATLTIDAAVDPILWNGDGTRLLTSEFEGDVDVWAVGE